MPLDIAALRGSTEPVRIFAYGLLMWDEDLPRAETETALLRGYHRSFCLYSYDYRGTRTQPGLTLGLDHGGACRGIAMRLSPAGLGAAIDRLWAPEMTRPGFTTCGCCRCGPPMARARPSPSRCAAAIRIMPAGCRLTRVRGSSPMPPAGGAPAAPISPIPCVTSPCSVSPTRRCKAHRKGRSALRGGGLAVIATKVVHRREGLPSPSTAYGPGTSWTGVRTHGGHSLGIVGLRGRGTVPWSEKSIMSQRREFVMLFGQARASITLRRPKSDSGSAEPGRPHT